MKIEKYENLIKIDIHWQDLLSMLGIYLVFTWYLLTRGIFLTNTWYFFH